MSKSNKELAVLLYTQSLRGQFTMLSSPNFKGKVEVPSLEQMAQDIAKLTKLLSTIEDQ
ncbi:hypothetical protein ERICIV_03399 [Paenibacillus larvae subsp. larvae]|uniref:Uncharacterized protein n=1 Tax=Paenibacillus larvae subsp. larvae TaxID=147375 RepID=A0A2L1UHD9_9BACL|nr:hypothetical protein [Paenibacillus larvae]AVF27765.1 hypothetical protein ERICIII_03656 [Paenibacillus larvae subsp. larvae]AVF32268.1 hypothetical protein ERICIV_03399 [Paenibacillus larvae subsp. larvae]MCY7521969.1 hypothetical protein [Paenibacillus larvae]MCY9500159.1 hypothetical protein [Paenibacillus larvae]MCY9680508.1 hypothetical protein [Paenibacillus larvae]